MSYIKLYVVCHSRLLATTISAWLHGSFVGVALRVRNRNHLRKSTSYLELYVGGRSQVSACNDQLLV